MSRQFEDQSGTGPGANESCDSQRAERAQAIEEIAAQVLELIDIARAAGLTNLSHLLEAAVLEAASQASTARWPGDGA
jgi:hypothetical protein